MKSLLQKTLEYSSEYLSSLKERRVAPSEKELELLHRLNHSLQEEKLNPEEVIGLLNEVGSKTAVANVGGRYFGFVIGGSLPAALAANWLAGTWDQNAGLAATSPFGSFKQTNNFLRI